MYYLLLLFAVITTISCQKSSNGYCYDKARDELNKTLERFKDPPPFTVPEEFKDYKNVLNRIKIIVSKVRKADELEKKLDNVEETLNKTEEEIKLIKTVSEVLFEIEESAKKLKDEQNKTQSECLEAEEKYKKLLKDFEEIKKYGERINETVGKISGDIKEINEKSLEIKKKVDEVKIPSYLSDKYIRDNKIKSFEDLINMAKRIIRLLQQIRDKILLDLKELTEKLKTGEIGKLPEISFTKEQLQKDIKFFTQQYEQAVRLKDLTDLKNQAKLDLDDIKKIAFELCRNGVCDLRGPVEVEN